MSVEEARHDLIVRLGWLGKPDHHLWAIDGLIFEAQAEFACENFSDGRDCPGMPLFDPRIGGRGMCRSCTARRKLAERKAVV